MKNIFLAILSGLLLALSWPTYGFAGLLFIAFIPLLVAINNIYEAKIKKDGIKVFGLSYLSFVIWNFITTWWLHYADFYAGLFAVLANALLMATLIRIYYFAKKRVGNHLSTIFLPALWISFEKMHLIWDLSWPWLNLGNGFAEYYKWIQWYEYTGVFGGTLWVWIVNLTLLTGVLKFIKNRNFTLLKPALIRTAILIIIPISYSYYIYANYQEKGDTTNIVVLQPNLDPYGEKFRYGDEKLSYQLTALAEKEIKENTSFVFGPETSLPDGIVIKKMNKYQAIKNIKQFISKHNKTNFVSGATLVNWYFDKSKVTETANTTRNKKSWYDIYNSAFLINNTDSISIYHKSKLVVGVEHMPFRNIIKPILGDYIINLGGTVGTHATQEERGVFTNNNISTAPIICYESVYGEFVTGYVQNGANILSVITNDGWWQNTQGHKQHLSFSRLRAIENRRSVARSANTGISAFINQRGDITKSLPYGVKGVLADDIHVNSELTVYTKFGDYIARVSFFIALIIFMYILTIRKKSLMY
jgi:apolipoprotein N-acyltransferase